MLIKKPGHEHEHQHGIHDQPVDKGQQRGRDLGVAFEGELYGKVSGQQDEQLEEEDVEGDQEVALPPEDGEDQQHAGQVVEY